MQIEKCKLHCGLWQKILATCIFVLLSVVATWALKDFLSLAHNPIKSECCGKLQIFAVGFLLEATGFYIFWSTVKYECYINSEGVGQTDGFRHKYVKWSEIHRYTLERVHNSRQRLIEPVLRDANAKVLMRPVAPIIVGSCNDDQRRAEFWALVTKKIDQDNAISSAK